MLISGWDIFISFTKCIISSVVYREQCRRKPPTTVSFLLIRSRLKGKPLGHLLLADQWTWEIWESNRRDLRVQHERSESPRGEIWEIWESKRGDLRDLGVQEGRSERSGSPRGEIWEIWESKRGDLRDLGVQEGRSERLRVHQERSGLNMSNMVSISA